MTTTTPGAVVKNGADVGAGVGLEVGNAVVGAVVGFAVGFVVGLRKLLDATEPEPESDEFRQMHAFL